MEIQNFIIPKNTDLNKIVLYEDTKKVVQHKNHEEAQFLSLLQKSFQQEEMFKALLDLIAPIDFEKEALGSKILKLRKDLENATDAKSREFIKKKIMMISPKIKQKLVIILRFLLKLSDKLGFGIGIYNEDIYCYKGRYWEKIDKDILLGFLGDFAEKAGLDNLDAQQFTVKEFLFKQFAVDAPIPNFNLPNPHPMILLQNGTLQFDGKVTLTGFKKEHYFKNILSFSFDLEATAPMFLKFLNRVLPDVDSQKILFEFIGSAFSSINHEKMLLLYGNGRNGKSVVFNIMYALFGEANVSCFSLQSLCEHSSQTIALIENTLMNFSSEIGSGKIDTDVMKQLTSKEPVKVKVVYKKPYIIRNYGRLIFNCNILPKDTENNEAFHRRMLILPFTQTITDEEVDIDLAKKIIATELPGILNMVIEGLSRITANKGVFTHSDVVKAELDKYKKDSSSILSFLHDERFVSTPKLKMPIETFYDMYREYCLKSQCQPFKRANFNNQLRSAGFRIERSTNGYYHIEYDNEFPDSAASLDVKNLFDL